VSGDRDYRGRLVAVESLLLVMVRSLVKRAPAEADRFIRAIAAQSREAIGRRNNIVAFAGLKHAVSDDALQHLVQLLENELPAVASQGPDAA
jgi:plasmid replication initiation protein